MKTPEISTKTAGRAYVRSYARVPVVAASAAAVALVTVFGAFEYSRASAADVQPPGVVHRIPGPVDRPMGFATIAERVRPAVVNVLVSGELASDEAGDGGNPQFRMPFPEGSPFGEYFKKFFGDQFQNGQPMPSPQPRKVEGQGSGFIVDPDGYIVTNNHVVDGADDITVTMTDGTKLKAKLIGRDPKTDLALIKVEAGKKLPSLSFGESTKARVGDWVLAVGNPFGLGGTVSAGIISARGRDIHSGPFDDFIQVDAAINRGNSGGPLIATDGTVIGINTAIFSPNGGNVGIGFAIPSDLAKPLIAELKEKGSIDRGWLGVQIQPVTPELAQGLGFGGEHGALVASIVPDSPAAKSGLKQGDIIVKVDGEEVTKFKDVPRMIANRKSGASAEIEVWRNTGSKKLAVTLGQLPEQEKLADAAAGTGPGAPKLGVALARIDDEARTRFHLPPTVQGVLVTAVQPGGPAALAGLRPGDVIKSVGQDKVDSPSDVVSQVEKAGTGKHDSVVLLIERQGEPRFVAVKLRNA